jgi:hypothetical protein
MTNSPYSAKMRRNTFRFCLCFILTGLLVSYGSAKANFEVLCAAGSSGALSMFFLLKTFEREQ